MKISDILDPSLIIHDLSADDKPAALRALANQVAEHATLAELSADEIFQALYEREQLGSTGVGEAVAIPHAKLPGLSKLTACFARAPAGIPFDAIDEQAVKLLFALLVPENSTGAHLKALARVSRLLKRPAFRKKLLDLDNDNALYNAFIDEDAQS